MGYTTKFGGEFTFNRTLDAKTHQQLLDLSETRHGGDTSEDPDYPGYYCQWIPTDDGTQLIWDNGEKFYNYVEWLRYIIDKILKPKKYVLNGRMNWAGEDIEDNGIIEVRDNHITTRELK